MLTTDEIKALALLIALALFGAGLAHLDARHPKILTLTLGDSLMLGRAAAPEPTVPLVAPTNVPDPAAKDSLGASVDVSGRIDVNRASAAELESLPGVGPKMAERIVEERTLRGRFKQPKDLRRVKGIGEKTLARLLPYIRTDGAASSAP